MLQGEGDQSTLTCLLELVSYSISLWDTFHAEDLHLDVVSTSDGIWHMSNTLLVDLITTGQRWSGYIWSY